MSFCRSLSLALVVVGFALVAVPAAAHPPTQHESQLLPASALGSVLDMDAQPSSTLTRACENGSAGPYPCRNVDLASFLPLATLGGATGNDVWGWTDPETQREYAIVGTSNSTAFVDVTEATDPVLVGVLPTRGIPDFVLWRDIKVDGNHAFIVSEVTGAGLQVFDLTRLRGRTSPGLLTADATYDGFSHAHNISINTETDTAYVVGSNTCGNGEENGGLHMLDISRPTEPQFAGCAVVEDADGNRRTESNNYAHDVECVVYRGQDGRYRGREICFGSNEDAVVIYDVTDRANARVITARDYEQASYTHQGSLTEDHRYFIFGDELDEQDNGQPTTTYILDVSDLDAPPAPKAHAHETKSIDHNLYVHGKRVYASNYTAGLRILEFDRASLADGRLEEVGYFDVVPGVDVAEFAGTWSNYRFPGSGNVVVSTIENQASGLFVLTPRLPEDGKKPRKRR